MPLSTQAQAWMTANFPSGAVSIPAIHLAIDYLERETRSGGECDPASYSCDAWRHVEPAAQAAARSPHTQAIAERFYLAWWMSMSANEAIGLSPHQSGKPSAAFNLALIRHQSSDPSSHLRWCALAMIDDERLGNQSGAAKEHLRSSAGIPATEITRLQTMARAQSTAATGATFDVLSTPEAVLTEYLETTDFLGFQVASSRRLEHEVNGPILAQLIASATTDMTGAMRERLCAYLSTLLPKYQTRRNLLALDQSHQTDVVSRPVGDAPPLLPELSGSILWESKNYSTSLTVSIVGYLGMRMMVTGAQIGVLVSQVGVSSQSTGAARHAWQMIQLIYQRTGRIIISITDTDLNRVASGSSLTGEVFAQATRFIYGT
jgi:hypothetical protein